MKINICNHDCTELWDGVLYKKLANYPEISAWEMKNIIDFINYEKIYGRKTEIIAEQDSIIKQVKEALNQPGNYDNVKRPEKITECTACRYRKGRMTEFVCHTAPLENAIKIFKCGSLLSAVKARRISADILVKEARNAANDPEDFFHYVMFAWGNCQAGDRLVMERKLKRMPSEEDLGKNLTPGVRFYFKYDKLDSHPGAIHDGFLPIKVNDYVYAIIIPAAYKDRLQSVIPLEPVDKVYYIKNDCKDIWDWSEKVYSFIEELKG